MKTVFLYKLLYRKAIPTSRDKKTLLNNLVKTCGNESSQRITECPGDRNPPKARYPYNLG